MKKLFILSLLLVVALGARAQYVTKAVTFDEFTMPNQNDYAIWFSGGVGYTYQMPVGPLGGYVIPPDSLQQWGAGNPTFCFKYVSSAAWDSCVTTIDFLYDTSGITASSVQRAASIWLNPSEDWNHYLNAAIAHNKKLEMSAYGWNNAASAPTLPLAHNRWYRLRLRATFITGFAGPMFDAAAQVYDLGDGAQLPVLIGEDSGGDGSETILTTDPAIAVSFSASKAGGAAKVDNFTFYGVLSSDSCEVITGCTPPTVSINGGFPLCYGESTGTVDLDVSGGAPPYSFMWSNGMTDEDIAGVPAASYTVTVVDAADCTAIASVLLTQPDSISIATSSEPDTQGAPNCNGTATAVANGGTNLISFLWSSGTTDATATGLCEGWYTVTATDDHGCTAADSAFVDFASSVSEVGEHAFDVFPNPAVSVALVTITQHAKEIELQLFSIDGKLLKTTKSFDTRSIELPVDDLAPALYFVCVRANGVTAYHKLSVQR